MCLGRTPAAKQIERQMIASIKAVPKSGSFTTRPATMPSTIMHGRKVFQNDCSAPARLSKKYAKKITSESFSTSDGCAEKPLNLIQRRAPLTGENAKTAQSKRIVTNNKP